MAHYYSLITIFTYTLGAMAFPRETAIVGDYKSVAAVTEAAAPAVTAAATLHCTGGSTVLYTTDCTMGTPVSYCHSPPPPIQCGTGYFPSVWHPGHCVQESTCFPLDAVWITTECSNGGIAYTTQTLYEGTLAGGQSTVIKGKFGFTIPEKITCRRTDD